MINEAIKSALKITIPSLNPDGSAGPFAALTSNTTTTTITTSRKSPPTTNGSSPKEATTSNNNNNRQPSVQDQMSPLRLKQTSPITNPSGYQSSPITNVLSHLHAAKKEAMLKTNAISPVASRSQTAPNSNNNNKMLPPHSRKSSTGPAPSMGVISEFDKTKYTLGKWVDTIIVQMNDPSIDDIELDDSIKKSNFNSMKEKEAALAAGNVANNASSSVPANVTSSSSSNLSANSNTTNGQQQQGTLSQQQQQQQTNKEFEYVEGDVDDDNDEDGNSDKDEGNIYLTVNLKRNKYISLKLLLF